MTGFNPKEMEFKKKYPCHWDLKPCTMFACYDCDKQKENMKRSEVPQQKVNRKRPMKGCSHSAVFYPTVKGCSECGLIITDMEHMGYHIKREQLEKMIEADNKRGNISQITKLKREGKWNANN